jgi:hypothetical protein
MRDSGHFNKYEQRRKIRIVLTLVFFCSIGGHHQPAKQPATHRKAVRDLKIDQEVGSIARNRP